MIIKVAILIALICWWFFIEPLLTREERKAKALGGYHIGHYGKSYWGTGCLGFVIFLAIVASSIYFLFQDLSP